MRLRRRDVVFALGGLRVCLDSTRRAEVQRPDPASDSSIVPSALRAVLTC